MDGHTMGHMLSFQLIRMGELYLCQICVYCPYPRKWGLSMTARNPAVDFEGNRIHYQYQQTKYHRKQFH